MYNKAQPFYRSVSSAYTATLFRHPGRHMAQTHSIVLILYLGLPHDFHLEMLSLPSQNPTYAWEAWLKCHLLFFLGLPRRMLSPLQRNLGVFCSDTLSEHSNANGNTLATLLSYFLTAYLPRRKRPYSHCLHLILSFFFISTRCLAFIWRGDISIFRPKFLLFSQCFTIILNTL